MDQVKADLLNTRLREYYGADLYGNANYRIVFGDDQREMRYGTFERQTEHGIFLGRETCWKEVPKYPFYTGVWVFEYCAENAGQNPEIKTGMCYEPLWFFKDKENNPLEPEWWACEYIVKAHRAVDRIKKSPEDLAAIEDLRMAREKARCKDIIQDESPYIAGLLHSGDAITVPSNFERSK